MLQTSCIALVPLVKGDDPAEKSHRKKPSPSHAGRKTIAAASLPYPKKAQSLSEPRSITRTESPMWAVVDAPFSRFAEAIRADQARDRYEWLNQIYESHWVHFIAS